MTLDKINQIFKNNKELEPTLKTYYDEFNKSITYSSDEIFSSEYGFSLGKEYNLLYTKELRVSSSEFSKLIAKSLGARFGDESEISDLILEQAHASKKANHDFDKYLKKFKENIIKIFNQDIEVYLPNNLVILDSKITTLKVGSVRILSLISLEKETTNIIKKMNNPDENISFNYKHDASKLFLVSGNSESSIPSSKMMWAVKTYTNKTNAKEEANWKIGVATSLIRLSSDKWGIHYPRIGTLEPSPTEKSELLYTNPLVRNGNNLSAGGRTVQSIYLIDKKISRDLHSGKNQKLFNSVFNFKPKMLSEQVFNALGWLSKGRGESDRSIKMLYFFTAIEAILSRGKDSPVKDTIARHGSVILAKKIKYRPLIAKQFKNLYDLRSSTIHKGKRSTLAHDVDQVQIIAETLIYVILKKCSLQINHETFCQQLAIASYGTRWPSK
ncbi:MAG: hypothetical protein HRU29_04155 [Rhizobiales bacterium]|nr:HEPN domain-containing protein [Hyphomicrobiales bacterium]NRB13574.1 hypothetical protein [Hyphomicrobiales bacterium]